MSTERVKLKVEHKWLTFYEYAEYERRNWDGITNQVASWPLPNNKTVPPLICVRFYVPDID